MRELEQERDGCTSPAAWRDARGTVLLGEDDRRPRSNSAPVATPDAVLPPHELSGPADGPLVVVLGGISASRHVTATADDPTPGWWEPLVGAGRPIDTTRVRVLSIDYLDGGRTGDGRPARAVTTHDQAAALAAVLDLHGVPRARAVVGASYGGMVALAFAERFPERVERLVVISAAHETHPMSTALRAVQRRIVELGLDTGRATDALALARALAMTTYRTADEFADRFDTAPVEQHAGDATFPVELYLRHVGEKFAAAWRPERFLALSLSADLHRVDPAAVRTPTVLIAAQGDTIVPNDQMKRLSARLAAPNLLVTMPTRHGHDAFLTEPEKIGRVLDTALTTSIPS